MTPGDRLNKALAVDENPAGGDQVVTVTPGADSRGGQRLVQAVPGGHPPTALRNSSS